MDNRSNTVSPLGGGACEQLHHGRAHPSPAGHCHHRRTGQRHSGPTSRLARIFHEFFRHG